MEAPTSNGTIAAPPKAEEVDETTLICSSCGHNNVDILMLGCGCAFHARCCSINKNCTMCNKPSQMKLLPMNFKVVDAARERAASEPSKKKRSRKRKKQQDTNLALGLVEGNSIEDRRTGRWTQEEIDFVDELMNSFEYGRLPLVNGVKLNDFLSSILQCKQSRLTKKMKNARLSSRNYVKASGYLCTEEAKAFSKLEAGFYESMGSERVRVEVRFHMQKTWRDFFSAACVAAGHPLDIQEWISSVEELERRLAQAKDTARQQRRNRMMRFALKQDIQNPLPGVYIDQMSRSSEDGNQSPKSSAAGNLNDHEELLNIFNGDHSLFGEHPDDLHTLGADLYGGNNTLKKSVSRQSFLDKVINYMKVNHLPFEHADLWVPSYISPNENDTATHRSNVVRECRLSFAGSETKEIYRTSHENEEEYMNLLAFGEYSQKFSFAVGSGLPGRVYQTGVPTWEQYIQNAPMKHFERCGGALQWGISTVVGIPIPSPKVGRVVCVLYSCHDRARDDELVGRLLDEFSTYLPHPRWELVVDVGHAPRDPQVVPFANQKTVGESTCEDSKEKDDKKSIEEMISILGLHIPSEGSESTSVYLPSFIALRLMLIRSSRSDAEEEWVRILLASYVSYKTSGRKSQDIASLLARDFSFLSGSATQNRSSQQQMPDLVHGQNGSELNLISLSEKE